MKRRSSNEQKVRTARRLREKQQRRADILCAAEGVFAARGFDAASIEQIAAAAEYAAGTVYLYFRDKEALYLELFEEKIRQLSDLIRRRIEGVKDPLQAIGELVAARMEYFERNRPFLQIYAREGMNCYETRRDRWNGIMRLYSEYLELLARLIGAAQRRKLLRISDAYFSRSASE